MQVWKGYKLNELGKVARGRSRNRPRNEPSLYGGKYPFVQTGDIKAANFYITEYTQTYSEKGLAQSKLWKQGTLCITIAANIAETAVLGIDACFPDSVIGFVADEKKSDVRFIKYHFDLLKMHLQSISQGTTQDNLSQEKLLKFTFNVPENINHQKFVASIVGNYDDLIEVNNQRIKLLEETAQELYKEWFVRMRFPGFKQAKFVKGLPKGIGEIKYFKDFIKLNRGFDLPEDKIMEGKYPVITSTSVKTFHNQFKVKAPIITTGRSGSLGTVQYVNQDGWPHNTSLYVKDFKGNEPHYVYYLLKTIDFASFNSGAGVPTLNQNHLHKLRFWIACKELQVKFKNFVEPIFNLLEVLNEQNNQLRQIRGRLLPRLISGRLEVKASHRDAKVIPIATYSTAQMVAEDQEPYKKVKPNLFFQRRVLAAYIIDKLKDEVTFGHVKLMKLMYLCEHLAEIETASNYHRDAAGPYDNKMIRSIDSQLKKAEWFECTLANKKYTYKPLAKMDEYKPWFTKYYSEKEVGIEALISLFGNAKTEKVEMVATLYEAHRDLREKKQMASPDAVINEVLNNWHDSKKRIEETRWRACFQWMKEQNWID